MYDKEKLLQTLGRAEYRTIDENGGVLLPSHNVYKEISDQMNSLGSVISAKHVYTVLKENRNGMKDYVKRTFNINQNVEINESLEDDNLSDRSNTKNMTSTENITFSLVLFNNIWKTVKSTKKTYNTRKYLLLQPGK